MLVSEHLALREGEEGRGKGVAGSVTQITGVCHIASLEKGLCVTLAMWLTIVKSVTLGSGNNS